MENEILRETVGRIMDAFGSDLERITIERAVFGLFFSGVKLSTGHGGVCYTPVKEMPEAVCCPSSARAMPLSGRLKGRTAAEYLEYIFDRNILKRTLGIAALNALSTLYWQLKPPADYTIQYGYNAFDDVDPRRYDYSVVVGALVPMLKKLIAADADFTVMEMDRRTLKGKELDHYLPPSEADKCVPKADLMVITGVTVLNDTLPGLLELRKPGAEILVTGPTVSMLPDAFFKRGVTSLGGIVVTKADELLDLLCEGGSGYHFFGKSAEQTVVRPK
ncbi:MAG: DUF364 domain-containing protein [Oscillospiraceae bacterium]|nr:DUF364 domain-containing protein [Oscillospiraceae bacterium]MBR4131666.1 DUF364 domain-containing protein [Oscillospiraceae bacterium]